MGLYFNDTDGSYNYTIPNQYLDNAGNNDLAALKLMGSAVKATPLGQTIYTANNPNIMVTGLVYYVVYYLPVDTTLGLLKCWMGTAGVYTASANFNGAGIYSLNPASGLCTQVATSANSPNVWKTAPGAPNVINMAVPYVAAAGLYVAAYLYQNTAETTAPRIYTGVQTNTNVNLLDFPFTMKIVGAQAATALPATILMSAMGGSNFPIYGLMC